MERLLERRVNHFKFVDRTFNLSLAASLEIMEFFLRRLQPGLFLHFEIVPDRLPEELRRVIAQFPPGTLQFEVGIQTFNQAVATRINRRQDYSRLEDNLRFLRDCTNVHVHADLIAGLPGEDLESFGRGFDRLIALGPQEIQVGILKRLRGAPIARHDAAWGMVYARRAPYEILRNDLLDFPTLQRLKRFARYWELIGNRGDFVESVSLLLSAAASPFAEFMALSDWLFATARRHHAIALPRLTEMLHQYLIGPRGLDPANVAPALLRDYQRPGRKNVPPFLRSVSAANEKPTALPEARRALRRQRRRTPQRS
jgi:hypothetical protein